jgi:hypothetical protein
MAWALVGSLADAGRLVEPPRFSWEAVDGGGYVGWMMVVFAQVGLPSRGCCGCGPGVVFEAAAGEQGTAGRQVPLGGATSQRRGGQRHAGVVSEAARAFAQGAALPPILYITAWLRLEVRVARHGRHRCGWADPSLHHALLEVTRQGPLQRLLAVSPQHHSDKEQKRCAWHCGCTTHSLHFVMLMWPFRQEKTSPHTHLPLRRPGR